MNLTVRNTPVSAHVMKLCAIVTMLIDHIGYVFAGQMTYQTYYLMRVIGRFAFPLFCLMIVEGFRYTRNRKRYLCGLFLFALVSEIPFDLAFHRSAFYWNNQNVFWTLAIGLSVLMCAEKISIFFREHAFPVFAVPVCQIIVFAILAAAAEFMRTDYDSDGVLLIVLIALGQFCAERDCIRRMIPDIQTARNLFSGIAVALWGFVYVLRGGYNIELFCICSVPLVLLYNGQRGRYLVPKWFFYAFYPVHLFLLHIIWRVCT